MYFVESENLDEVTNLNFRQKTQVFDFCWNDKIWSEL